MNKATTFGRWMLFYIGVVLIALGVPVIIDYVKGLIDAKKFVFDINATVELVSVITGILCIVMAIINKAYIVAFIFALALVGWYIAQIVINAVNHAYPDWVAVVYACRTVLKPFGAVYAIIIIKFGGEALGRLQLMVVGGLLIAFGLPVVINFVKPVIDTKKFVFEINAAVALFSVITGALCVFAGIFGTNVLLIIAGILAFALIVWNVVQLIINCNNGTVTDWVAVTDTVDFILPVYALIGVYVTKLRNN